MTGTDTHAHCLRKGCGRRLTAPASVAAGYGPTCLRKVRAAVETVAAAFKPAQVAAALQLIGSGQITPADARGAYLVTSSDGLVDYLTTASTCNCPAARRHLACKHRCGVQLYAAAA